ncbi:DMP19 family protein [Flavobacterium chilense]|uniref:DNA mimic protein DMP19 C-terminal domain-containing protein n=1 Tax=Flavobacterium chilense TaxID=946677 RepID=A0A1M6ZF55_9FLAO|nr:hypothetical protein [Flavobacterium chilense]SHL29070.1 hypothetical protein SAMN05444484_101997 [Flavobacterium chilense]
MNFIEKTLNNLCDMTADDVVQSMAKIYNEPIDRNKLLEYPQFIRDIIFLIDFDTEMNMQGDVLQNSIKEHVPNIITALGNIEANNESKILQEIYKRFQQNPDDEMIDKLYAKMYLYTDFDIWLLLDIYVEKQMKEYILKSNNENK